MPNSEQIDIYIGYDPREAVAYYVCQQSIIENAKEPERLAFHPVRGERRDGSNDFIYARFLVPWMAHFAGSAIFLDGDMLVREDIAKLYDLRRLDMAAQVVKREYKTKHPVKYLGNKNEDYPRKNWSSVILWNCNHFGNRCLTPDFVASKDGAFLHRFEWLEDARLGELPEEWNRLVLEQPIKPADKLLHYTIGTPCFPHYAHSAGSDEWYAAYRRMCAPC